MEVMICLRQSALWVFAQVLGKRPEGGHRGGNGGDQQVCTGEWAVAVPRHGEVAIWLRLWMLIIHSNKAARVVVYIQPG